MNLHLLNIWTNPYNSKEFRLNITIKFSVSSDKYFVFCTSFDTVSQLQFNEHYSKNIIEFLKSKIKLPTAYFWYFIFQL
uniref:Uncharacterized protein n=1 Tax=Octopus bimaculoides TaxID=37653 RepID=A0A0L8GMU7_OCTBM